MATFKEIIGGSRPVLVDFFAAWCGPCKMMKPILEEVKYELGEQAIVLKIDVDKNPVIASQLGIQGVPTLVLFRNGHIVWRQSGVIPANRLANIVREHL